MRIKILSSAVEDLHLGRVFYEDQGEGLGDMYSSGVDGRR